MGRCIGIEISSGHEPSQAAAICYAKWDEQNMNDITRIRSFKKWRNSPDSSNVAKIMYNDETEELVLQFHDRSIYTYSGVSFNLFRDIIDGNGVCRTEGENRWGSWYVGKSPSVGAAVYQRLIEANISYTKGGSLR